MQVFLGVSDLLIFDRCVAVSGFVYTLFSQFKYNLALWPEEYVAKTGNLVFYKCRFKTISSYSHELRVLTGFVKVHNFGGHFAGLDNPPALIEDIREMGVYFKA
jgi:hypothetical protein